MSEVLKRLVEQAEKRERAYAQQVEQAYAQWMQLQGMLAAERTGLSALREALRTIEMSDTGSEDKGAAEPVG